MSIPSQRETGDPQAGGTGPVLEGGVTGGFLEIAENTKIEEQETSAAADDDENLQTGR